MAHSSAAASQRDSSPAAEAISLRAGSRSSPSQSPRDRATGAPAKAFSLALRALHSLAARSSERCLLCQHLRRGEDTSELLVNCYWYGSVV